MTCQWCKEEHPYLLHCDNNSQCTWVRCTNCNRLNVIRREAV
jgi:hypothetical protein